VTLPAGGSRERVEDVRMGSFGIMVGVTGGVIGGVATYARLLSFTGRKTAATDKGMIKRKKRT
jgi:hypothetical protein